MHLKAIDEPEAAKCKVFWFIYHAIWSFIRSIGYLVTLLAVWLSGNALACINVVALRQTRLVPGWVTVCGRVNHLGM